MKTLWLVLMTTLVSVVALSSKAIKTEDIKDSTNFITEEENSRTGTEFEPRPAVHSISKREAQPGTSQQYRRSRDRKAGSTTTEPRSTPLVLYSPTTTTTTEFPTTVVAEALEDITNLTASGLIGHRIGNMRGESILKAVFNPKSKTQQVAQPRRIAGFPITSALLLSPGRPLSIANMLMEKRPRPSLFLRKPLPFGTSLIRGIGPQHQATANQQGLPPGFMQQASANEGPDSLLQSFFQNDDLLEPDSLLEPIDGMAAIEPPPNNQAMPSDSQEESRKRPKPTSPPKHKTHHGSSGEHALEGPRCDRFSDDICLDDYEYPAAAVMDAVYKEHSKFKLLYSEIKNRENQVSGLSPQQEESYTYEHYYGSPHRHQGNIPPRDYGNGGGFVCPSEVHYGRPKRARNPQGSWKVIVNVAEFSQTLRLEKCLRPALPCSYMPFNLISSCTQIYSYQRMLVFEKEKGLHMDIFRVPAGCSCHIKGVSYNLPPPQGATHHVAPHPNGGLITVQGIQPVQGVQQNQQVGVPVNQLNQLNQLNPHQMMTYPSSSMKDQLMQLGQFNPLAAPSLQYAAANQQNHEISAAKKPATFSNTLWSLLTGTPQQAPPQQTQASGASAMAINPDHLKTLRQQLSMLQQLQQYPQLAEHISTEDVLDQLLKARPNKRNRYQARRPSESNRRPSKPYGFPKDASFSVRPLDGGSSEEESSLSTSSRRPQSRPTKNAGGKEDEDVYHKFVEQAGYHSKEESDEDQQADEDELVYRKVPGFTDNIRLRNLPKKDKETAVELFTKLIEFSHSADDKTAFKPLSEPSGKEKSKPRNKDKQQQNHHHQESEKEDKTPPPKTENKSQSTENSEKKERDVPVPEKPAAEEIGTKEAEANSKVNFSYHPILEYISTSH